MIVDYGINPNCSEAVFRFYTLNPKEIQAILQAIGDEVNACYPKDKPMSVPLFKTAEEYDTQYKGGMSYSGEVREKYADAIDRIWKERDSGKITQEVALKRYDEIKGKMSKEIYPKSLLSACAGLGDNEAVIKIEKALGAFRLNIGNNDISENKTSWTEKVRALGIKVQEAEFSKDLRKVARDCTCGITFFEGYDYLIKDPKKKIYWK